MRFNAFNPSDRSTVSASLAGATGRGASTKPLLSIIAEDFFALLMFVAGIANPIAAFLRHRVGCHRHAGNIKIEVAVRRQMRLTLAMRTPD